MVQKPLACASGSENAPGGEGLTADQQEMVLQLLVRGASPAVACQQLGVSTLGFNRSAANDDRFRARLDAVRVTLSQNVAAAVYREAMQGSVPAQTLWLKSCPPPEWRVDELAGGPMTFDEAFEALSDDDLIDLARALGVDLPPEIERKAGQPRGQDVAGRVSPSTDPEPG